MFKKFLSIGITVIAFSFIFLGRVYAVLDINLEDNKEEKHVSVLVESYDTSVDGIDMSIKYSDDISISDVSLNDEFCTFGGSATFTDEKILIECLNDSDTQMSGALATITYTASSDDYFFYVDQSTLDTGSLAIGEITDINKPEEVEDTTNNEEENEETFLSQATAFIKENPFYIIAGAIVIVSVIITALVVSKKDDKEDINTEAVE